MRPLRNSRLFIYCAGGQGREVLKTARSACATGIGWEEILFVDDGCAGDKVNDIPVLSLAECLERFGPEDGRFHIASGEPSLRRRLSEQLCAQGRRLEAVVHPSVEGSLFHKIGEGAFLGEGAALSDNLSVGFCACVNANATIGHNTVIGEYAVVSPGAVVSGNVTIGEGTYIGTGAIIRDEVKIGRNSIIGMGSLVTKDIPDGVVAYGAPCQIIRENQDGIVFR